MNLVKYILRQFFKAVEEDGFLAVQAFFPMNRGHWKEFSSWTPPETTKRGRGEVVEDTKFPSEVQVKKGYSWSEQLGVAIACLVEDGKTELIDWVKQVKRLARWAWREADSDSARSLCSLSGSASGLSKIRTAHRRRSSTSIATANTMMSLRMSLRSAAPLTRLSLR